MDATDAQGDAPLLAKLLKCHPKMRVRDPKAVEMALNRLESSNCHTIDGGPDKLQFVVDFDYTLTRAHDEDGQPVDCSWGVMENSSLLPKGYTDRTNALRAKYLPIEHDSNMTIAEKTPYMVEWYKAANLLLQDIGIQKNMFPAMVKTSNVAFRDRTSDMLLTLHSKSVPVLILSAGLGDLVLEILKHFNTKHKNVHVVSNFLDFNESGRVTGIKGEMIHVFNKNESVIHDSPYFKDLEHRKNIILMGDSIGDLHMADGVKNPEVVLKIGFINDKEPPEKKLSTYLGLYDIVLLDDQSMRLPCDIIAQILKKED